MRLLHTTKLEFQEFFDAAMPEYSILSHTWSDSEVTFHTFNHSRESNAPEFKKIADCCRLAREHGVDWAWIDTCCIDKTSSAELSEAINSMFHWYQRSKICFVFLTDLEASSSTVMQENDLLARLSKCRWFTRGWTLQELLAPSDAKFYDSGLQYIGTTSDLAVEISTITGIGKEYLLHGQSVRDASLAQRMSWASQRQTSRVEDMAYCLLGIFNVNMPLLYGEGRRAFLRLQQQIITQSSDESIFAWMSDDQTTTNTHKRGIFADWPSEFRHSGGIYHLSTLTKRPPYTVTNRGLQLHIPTSPWKNWLTLSTPQVLEFVELWLDCVHEDPGDQSATSVVGIRIRAAPSHNDESAEWYRIDSTKLVLREEKRMHVAENFLFGSWHPIYAVQSTLRFSDPQPATSLQHLNATSTLQNHDNHLQRQPSFDRKASRNLYQILEALCMSFWLLYVGIYPVVSQQGEGTFSHEAAWTWHYITYGFIFRRSNFRFHTIVCVVLHLKHYVYEGLLRTMASPMVIMGTAILIEVVADRFRTVFHRKVIPAKRLDGKKKASAWMD